MRSPQVALSSSMLVLVACACLLAPSQSQAQIPGNLSFDDSGSIYPDRPPSWFIGGAGYVVRLDTLVAYGGEASLRSASTAPPAIPGALGASSTERRGFGVATQSLPVDPLRGKTVRYSGWIRTSGITDGYAGLWMRVDGPQGVHAFDNMESRGPSGTSDWTRFSIELVVDSAATGVVFGVLHPGNGTAWFDELELSADGAPFDPGAYALWTPDDDQLALLSDEVVPLSPELDASADDGLRDLLDWLDDARIVGLGEGTHGTREFFTMKHRVLRGMAAAHPKVVFAIEASMPQARRLNEYVTGGTGDPATLLHELGFWTWDTEEVLTMLRWMRSANQARPGSVEFWGFDMQSPAPAADSVFAFAGRADPDYLPELRSSYGIARSVWTREPNSRTLAGIREWRREARQVVDYLNDNRERYLLRLPESDVEWGIQYARLVLQAASIGLPDGVSRDRSMADNVAWIARRNPGVKLVLWAHNAHVQTCDGMLGDHLAGMFGEEYHAVGLTFGDGEYNAVGPRGLRAYPEPAPPPGTLEHAFRRLALPGFALNLRNARLNDGSGFLAEPRLLRSIGSRAMDGAFASIDVAQCFDHLIHVDGTTPSRLLR